MAIQFPCPTCGKELKAPDETAGRRGKCPHCQGSIVVPEPVYQAEEVPVADAVADQDVYALEPQAPEAPVENRRPCPACGELIMVTAVKCRFCGEIFDPTLRRARRTRSRKSSYEDDNLSALDWVLCVLCGNIACIVAIVYMVQGKSKGWKMLAITLAIQFALGVIWAMITVAMENH
jgi:hypothetical protein